MATPFRLAALGHTMEKGRIVEWHIDEGQSVDEGDLLVSVETDKTVVEVNSPLSGVLLKQVASVDGEYDVGDVLAWVGEEGESVPEVPDPKVADGAAAPAGPRVTPVAQRLADRHGIDAEALAGSGPDGRVTKEDVQRAIDSGTATSVADAEDSADSDAEIVPLTGIRRTTAERLSANWAQAPHVSEGVEVDFTDFSATQSGQEAAWRDAHDLVPGVNDLVLAAVAKALQDYPDLNAGYVGGAMHRYRAINLGVAIDTEAGLVVPVIKDADRLDLIQIARAVREYAVKAREGKLMPDDLGGATFSISNLGGLGVDWFTPVLNPPQCAILGVGRVHREPRCVGEAIVARDVATLVLTFDHRLVDGAPCARFLGRLRELLEAPESLLP